MGYFRRKRLRKFDKDLKDSDMGHEVTSMLYALGPMITYKRRKKLKVA